MWYALNNEIMYFKYYWIILILSILFYSGLSIFDIQLTDSPEWAVDYWGGLFSLIIYAFLIIVWGRRISEKRIRLHNLLPLTQKHNAYLRFTVASLPYVFLTVHLVIINLVLIENWHAETGSIVGQVGITLILFAGFVRGRDDWFSHWSFGKRFRSAFVTVFIIQIIFVFIFSEKPGINEGLVDRYGIEAFHYANLIFPALGFAILATSIFSYIKRKTYLI